MKGFSIKKLAAVAAGAALVGSALAPVAFAGPVTKGDLYAADGSPNVSVVVGSAAQLSDAVWAGNIAAAIAAKAYTTQEVSVSGTAGEGASATVEDLSVDLTVGGTVTVGAGSYIFKQNLDSVSGNSEIHGNNDTNAITDSKLEHLYNATVNQRINNGDQVSQTPSPTVQETIGLKLDARMETSSSTAKDLLALISGSGQYYYQTKFSPALDLGSTSFTDGTDDVLKVIFFGEEYELSSATLTGTKNLKLVKSSDKKRYDEGQYITGLAGRNAYEGKELQVLVNYVAQAGTAVSTYSVSVTLYDGDTEVQTQTVASGQNLADVFQDSSGDYALLSNLFIDSINVASTSGKGYVEVTTGSGTVLLYDTKGYPYDSTSTATSYPWKVEIGASSTDANALSYIKILNDEVTWSTSTGGTYEQGPLYPTYTGQGLSGKTSGNAVLLKGLPEDTQGYGYAQVEFAGFETGKEMTPIEIGNNVTGLPSNAVGGVSFPGASDEMHNLPFAFYHGVSSTGSFAFDTKTTYFDLNKGSDGTLDGAADLNFRVATLDYVNGRQWTISDYNGSDFNLGVQGYGRITGDEPADFTVGRGNTFTIDNINYVVMDNNTTAGTGAIVVKVDAAIRYKTTSSSTPGASDLLFNIAGDTTDVTYGWLLLQKDRVFDTNAPVAAYATNAANGIRFSLIGRDSDRYFYAAKVVGSDRIWLMLDDQNLGVLSDGGFIQNNHVLRFSGTDSNEVNRINYTYYAPDSTDFDTLYNDPNQYFVAEFRLFTAVETGGVGGGPRFNTYIDTETGGNLGPFSNSQLSTYGDDVNFTGSPALNLRSGTQSSYYQKAYTDAGVKAWLLDNDSGVKFSIPESRLQSVVNVHGKEVTTSVTGGEKLTGVEVGKEAKTAAGTTVTVDEVHYTATCGAGDAGTCVATPTSYMMPAVVPTELVMLDVDNPAGKRVIVGGPLVNALAGQVVGLSDRLTAAGDKVMEVTPDGDVVVAGFTAEDTIAAARELIGFLSNM
ncbi:MAG: S-layer protein, partial [Candidatus Diapherotrites archaeon]|nr:S-layer protein [Candidatus Diapherotrites archaeon]